MTEPTSHSRPSVDLAEARAQDTVRVLLEVLDDIELSVRMGNTERLVKCAFVWAQARDRLMTGVQSWEDQRIDSASAPWMKAASDG